MINILEIIEALNLPVNLGEYKLFRRGSNAVVAERTHNPLVDGSNPSSPTIQQPLYPFPWERGLLPFLKEHQGFKSPYIAGNAN